MTTIMNVHIPIYITTVILPIVMILALVIFAWYVYRKRRRGYTESLQETTQTAVHTDVFLSYCVCDTGRTRGGDFTAIDICDHLRSLRKADGTMLKVFMDTELKAGDDWSRVLNLNLRNAACMVAVCSEHYAQTRPPGVPMAGTSWTRNEVVAYMKIRPEGLIPVTHSGKWPPESLFLECSGIEDIDLQRLTFEDGMNRLGKAVLERCEIFDALNPRDSEPPVHHQVHSNPVLGVEMHPSDTPPGPPADHTPATCVGIPWMSPASVLDAQPRSRAGSRQSAAASSGQGVPTAS